MRVHIDYHVEFQRHYYSVPHALIRKQLDLRITATTLECFHKGVRVAAHHRSPLPGRHTTLPEHMPEKHRRYGDWTPERFQRWAATIGPATAQLIANRLRQRRHPEQAYRSCLGILRLAKTYGDDRLEAACARALLLGTSHYKSIASILSHGLDQQPPSTQHELSLPTDHDNLRGPGYYH